MATQKSGKRKYQPKSKIMKAGDQENRYQLVLNAQSELENIEQILRWPGEWLRLSTLDNPDATDKEAIGIIRKRKTELEKILKKCSRGREKPVCSTTGEVSTLALQRRPFRMDRTKGLLLNTSVIQAALTHSDQIEPDCPILTIGQVQASSFFEYLWAAPDDVGGARGSAAFWPLNLPPQIPNSTFNGDWGGSTGANFWGWVSVPGTWPFHKIDSFASAAVFQFSIPAPECDSIVYWGTNAVVDAPTPWSLSGWGRIDTDWVLHESPVGGGFPSSIVDSFQFFADGLYQHTNSPESTTKRSTFSFNRNFRVSAGDSPKIYLGLSLMAMAANGIASTIEVGGFGDYFEFEHGITYFMTPEAS